MQQQQALIIGSGSMGQRFAKIFSSLGVSVTFFKYSPHHSTPPGFSVCSNLNEFKKYSICCICTPTATHLNYLKLALEAGMHVFVEKPIADTLTGLDATLKIRKANQIVQVGFNLRTVPITKIIQEKLPLLGKILYAHFTVGQYLPSWRPQVDYQRSYSSSYAMGGGVALDLIHELDLAFTLFPQMKLKDVYSDKLSNLKIDVEDYVEYRFSQPELRISLDYLSPQLVRSYRIVGEKAELVCDVPARKLIIRFLNGTEESYTEPELFDRDMSFVIEIQEFLTTITNGKKPNINDRVLGIDALKIALSARKQYVQK